MASSSSKNATLRREMAPWILVVSGALIAVVLGFVGWRIATATESDAGPRMQVHPGMYDIRAEIAKRNAAHGNETSPPSK